jgi:hypothetical protein
VSLYVVGRQRLFEPADVGGLVMAGAPDRLVDVEGLISVGENLEVGAERRAQRIQSFDVLADRAPDLDLGAPRMMTSRSKWRPSNSCSMPISLPMPTLPAARPTS